MQVYQDQKFDNSLEINLQTIIKGSNFRKGSALQLIKLIIDFRPNKLYLDYRDDNVLEVYQKMHNSGTELADISYTCMYKLLKKNLKDLMYSNYTYALMKIKLNYPLPCVKGDAFLKFAKRWFSRIEKENVLELPLGMKEIILMKIEDEEF